MAEKQLIRGCWIGPEELETIRQFVQQHWDKGRSKISEVLCRHWDWKQPNGWLKDRACRDLLLTLHRQGKLELPPRRHPGSGGKKRVPKQGFLLDSSLMEGPISRFGSLTLTMVRKTSREALWDQLVHRHHYMGRPLIVGSYLKYLAYLDGRVVACLGWGSAAWKATARDAFIGWDEATRKRNLCHVVDNVRFLILPWVRIPHLASKVLAANIRILPRDWLDFYHIPLWLAETFVDTSRFAGTCYRAANWIHVGHTWGSAKRGASYRYHGMSKAIYLYPLHKRFRERLHG